MTAAGLRELFDRDIIQAVAEETGCASPTVDTALVALQQYVSGYEAVGGVDGLVYEWRQSFREDPLVERTAHAYYLIVPAAVWSDVADRLDLEAVALESIMAVHARQFLRAHPQALEADPTDTELETQSRAPLILVQPRD